MKISFQKDDITQEPVTPAQVVMRNKPIRKRPILKLLILCMIVSLAAYAAYRLQRQRALYAYGIVAGPVQRIYGPFKGRIEHVLVHQGSYVKKGQLLFSIMPESPTGPVEPESATADESIRPDLLKARQARQTKLERARLEIARQQEAFRRAEAERESAIAKTRIEVQKLTEFYAGKKKRYHELAALLKMDAAVSSQVDSAYNAMQLARHNLEQARIDFQLAQKRDNPYRLTLQMARLSYDALLHESSGNTSSGSAILRASTEPIKALPFYASGDAVVTTVNVNQGDFILPGQLLAVVANLEQRWLNAYVPASKATHIHKGQSATLYAADNLHGISGTVTSRGVVVETPEALLEKMPDARRSVYVRIDFQTHAGQDILPGGIVKVVIEP